MSDISQISIDGNIYNIKDVVARQDITQIQPIVSTLNANSEIKLITEVSEFETTNYNKKQLFIGDTTTSGGITYTKNHWYYFTGTNDPHDGGVWTDTSLSIDSAAADAKATGDAIDKLEDKLTQITNKLEDNHLTNIYTNVQVRYGLNYNTGLPYQASKRLHTIEYLPANITTVFGITNDVLLALYVYDPDDPIDIFKGVFVNSALSKGIVEWQHSFNIAEIRKILQPIAGDNLFFKVLAKYDPEKVIQPDDTTINQMGDANIIGYKTYLNHDQLLATIGMYEKWAVCGASYDAGYYYYTNSAHRTDIQKSWPEILARRVGNTCKNYAKAGSTTQSHVTRTNNNPSNLENILTDINNEGPCELYVLTFGGNDGRSNIPIGTVDDISAAEPDSFYGYYSKIIDDLMASAENAHFILTTPSSLWINDQQTAIDTAIKTLANHYQIPLIVWESDPFMNSTFFINNNVGNHPTPILAGGMALAFERLYSKCVLENMNYFNSRRNTKIPT